MVTSDPVVHEARPGRLNIGSTGTPFWWDAAPPHDNEEDVLPSDFDVVVIGAGYTGLGAALTLARGGRDVLVLDANAPGTGASTRNLGFFGSDFRISLSALVSRYGKQTAMQLASTALDGFEHSKSIIETEQIQCELQDLGRLVCAARPKHYDTLAREADLLQQVLPFNSRMLSAGELRAEIGTDAYYGGLLRESAFCIDPGKWVRGLLDRCRSAGVRIMGNTLVKAIARPEKRIFTDRGAVAAKNILVATNAYTGDFIPELKRRLVPTGANIIVTEPLSVELMREVLHKPRLCIDTLRIYRAFRPSPDGTRLMFAGRSGDPARGPEHNGKILRRKMVGLFPRLAGAELSHSWGGYVGFSFDFLPHLGELEGVHYAVGLNGAGTTMAPYLGHRIALKILGQDDGDFLLDRFEFKQRLFYTGDPWFLPAVLGFYRVLDALRL